MLVVCGVGWSLSVLLCVVGGLIMGVVSDEVWLL